MQVNVGIISGEKIEFSFEDNFIFKQKNTVLKGDFVAEISDGKILFDEQYFTELLFENNNNSVFGLKNVKIGINFHWEQYKNQYFEGNLKIISDGTQLVAVNIIDVEKYLCSVISSEMRATSYIELLKAHTVISRSWLLANINSKNDGKNQFISDNSRLIRWYERDAHSLFDVCADDHCQRYQGVQKDINPQVLQAIEATQGEVLTCKNEICDTRYSKCCGGKTEIFSSCWADKNFDYLSAKMDSDTCFDVDLTKEKNVENFIFSPPKCFCNTDNKTIINQVLNDYDQKTNNFFRWQAEYSNSELSAVLHEKTGIDFGKIVDLIPLTRGESGRITLLKIVGTKRALSVGKELEIRRCLSKTHLYSSAFVVEKDGENFVLHGAGWGHGVGLCQIGAAVMSAEGYNYQQILAHYFSGTAIERLEIVNSK